jgi:hypothetical protein
MRRRSRLSDAPASGVPNWLWYALGGGALVLLVTGGSMAVEQSLLGVKDKALWAARLFAVIGTELPQLSIRAKVLIVAHAAFESGWGQDGAAKRGTNNIFNITAGGEWLKAKKPVLVVANADLSYDAKECARVGRPMSAQPNGKLACKIDQTWRKYPTVNAAIQDYWDFLGPNQNGGRYLPARNALVAGDVTGFAQAAKAAGYFTLPVDEYSAQLAGMLASVAKRLGISV